MIPIGDVIPTRTPPIMTVVLIALSVIFSTQTLSGGFGAVIFEMVFFWLFGWTVEDRLGHARFTALYLLCGGAASMLTSPFVAISCAVAAVIGAYFVLYPKSSMLVLIPLPLMAVEIPVVVFLALWCLLQIVTGVFVPPFIWFFAGAALCVVLKRPERVKVDWWSP